MATSTTATRVMGGLTRRLVLDGLLSEEEVMKHHREALEGKKNLISSLIEKKIVDSRAVAQLASKEFGLPVMDIGAMEIDQTALKLVNESIIRKYNVLPLYRRGKCLFVATPDPTNIDALNDIKFATGLTIEAIAVEEDRLSQVIESSFSRLEDSMAGMEESELAELDNLEADVSDDDEDDDAIDDAPVVRFVNKVLVDAIQKKASDLHFEPYEKIYRVRFRIDGMLSEIAKPPLGLSNKIVARIKVMSRLDVSERRVPQDGRVKIKLSKSKSIDFRVSTCPTLFGEKVCMRILDSDPGNLRVDRLGYEDAQKELFLKNLHRPYGMFLVTGPTGSGKTVSLYAGINILNKDDINIATAEDPVEINLPGVNQVQVDERTGMTFPKALKAFLRQDPDVILVGEIRDIETGGIAIKAAQTGHMVLSTLHTNDAPQTITRMQDMGIAPFALATSVNLITAQRLCRRLHTKYRSTVDVPRDALLKEGVPKEWLEDQEGETISLYVAGDGGEDCPTGYEGRIGIYQVMSISDAMKRLIIDGANAVQLADQACTEGIWDIRTAGLSKVMAGITSLSEVNRVTIE